MVRSKLNLVALSAIVFLASPVAIFAKNDQVSTLNTKSKEETNLIRKQKQIEIAQKICSAKSQRADKFRSQLARLREIVAKVLTRSSVAKNNGKDVSGVETAGTTANTAIMDAEVTINSLATKPCDTNPVTSSATKKVENLETDYKAAATKMQTARKAVSEMISAMAKVSGEKITEKIPNI